MQNPSKNTPKMVPKSTQNRPKIRKIRLKIPLLILSRLFYRVLHLNIFKHIIELHGGSIEASNKIGRKKGARVEVLLPVHEN